MGVMVTIFKHIIGCFFSSATEEKKTQPIMFGNGDSPEGQCSSFIPLRMMKREDKSRPLPTIMGGS